MLFRNGILVAVGFPLVSFGVGAKGRRVQISLVVTVKAYPAISRKHGEAVCVAGIRTDTAGPRWVRLWPIEFRDLPFSQRFQKYQEITLSVEPSNDTRPESFRPVPDTLVLGKTLGTERGWALRKPLIEPLVVESMCEVIQRQQQERTSLAVFRPGAIDDFLIEQNAPEWDPKQQAVIAQPSLFLPDKRELRKIPYRFKYRYRCPKASCPGHEQSIIDWELAQAFLGWSQYPEAERLNQIKAKWLGQLCGPDRDTHFFVGNQHQYPSSFVVLGVFYPPKDSVTSEQLHLMLD